MPPDANSSQGRELDMDAAARGLAAMEQALAENRRLREWLNYIEHTTADDNVIAAVELALEGKAVEWGER